MVATRRAFSPPDERRLRNRKPAETKMDGQKIQTARQNGNEDEAAATPEAAAANNDENEAAAAPEAAAANNNENEAAAANNDENEAAAAPEHESKLLSREEQLEGRKKAVLYFRHRLQKGFMSRDQAPKEEDIANMSNNLKQLEAYKDLEEEVIKNTKNRTLAADAATTNDQNEAAAAKNDKNKTTAPDAITPEAATVNNNENKATAREAAAANSDEDKAAAYVATTVAATANNSEV
ncbi:hypothetical protein BDV96DRAFT_601180 [Lophiotrema nucula]|uniref:Uncharacterized protein n=1 Tax=Lophiotrema nucula TaxID=690887 RepID=A0A6A5Z2P0_9PLEO|nr:hypothetical protein BDV96DRAFT_601180 [Lophiotrema nucula]